MQPHHDVQESYGPIDLDQALIQSQPCARLAVLHARRRHVGLGRRGGGRGRGGGRSLAVLGAAEFAGGGRGGAPHPALAEVVLAECVAHHRRLAAAPPAPVLPAAP